MGIRELLVDAARRLRDGDLVDDVVVALVLTESGAGEPGSEPATRAASGLLVQTLDPLWHRGWQPADLLHVVGSQLTRRIASWPRPSSSPRPTAPERSAEPRCPGASSCWR